MVGPGETISGTLTLVKGVADQVPVKIPHSTMRC